LINLKAYILINSELGREADIISALENVKEIKNIYSLYGIYDLIVEMEADTMDLIKEIVFNKIRRNEILIEECIVWSWISSLLNPFTRFSGSI